MQTSAQPDNSSSFEDDVCAAEVQAQAAWAAESLNTRLGVIARARDLIARDSTSLTSAISPDLARTPADTLAAEILPLLAACRFLERSAARILRPRIIGRRGRPFWLPGVSHRVRRVPLGRVLVIAPGNYPLFLPGVQTLQALVAGNSVVWKPGRGGEPVARVLQTIFTTAGLPPHLLRVTGEDFAVAQQCIAEGIDKIVLTGSTATGHEVLAAAARTLTPVVAELSGCDSVVVLPGADLNRVTEALAFGLRLNGSATCMAPRRLLLVDASPQVRDALLAQVLGASRNIAGVHLPPQTREQLRLLVDDALRSGATVHGELADRQQPVIVTGGPAGMRIAHSDLFAPVLTVIDVADETGVLVAEASNPYALTCSIFGPWRRARTLASRLTCGTVVINDVIAPTADPRVPFGGRRQSGFGVTRGEEGLLEMTAPQVVTSRRGNSTRHLQQTNTAHEGLFRAAALAGYAGNWKNRFAGMRTAVRALRSLGDQK